MPFDIKEYIDQLNKSYLLLEAEDIECHDGVDVEYLPATDADIDALIIDYIKGSFS